MLLTLILVEKLVFFAIILYPYTQCCCCCFVIEVWTKKVGLRNFWLRKLIGGNRQGFLSVIPTKKFWFYHDFWVRSFVLRKSSMTKVSCIFFHWICQTFSPSVLRNLAIFLAFLQSKRCTVRPMVNLSNFAIERTGNNKGKFICDKISFASKQKFYLLKCCIIFLNFQFFECVFFWPSLCQ